MPGMFDFLYNRTPAELPPLKANDTLTYDDILGVTDSPSQQIWPFARMRSPRASTNASRAATGSSTVAEPTPEPITSCNDTVTPTSSSAFTGVTLPGVQGVSLLSEDLPPIFSESLVCELAAALACDTRPGDVQVSPPMATAVAVVAHDSVHADEKAIDHDQDDWIAAAEGEVRKLAAQAQEHKDVVAEPLESEEEPEKNEVTITVSQNAEAAAAAAASPIPRVAAAIAFQDAPAAVVVAGAVPELGAAATAVTDVAPTAGHVENRWLLHGTAAAKADEKKAAADLTKGLGIFQLNMPTPEAKAAAGANAKKADPRKTKAPAKRKAAPAPEGELRAVNFNLIPPASRAPTPAHGPPRARLSSQKTPDVPCEISTRNTAVAAVSPSNAASFAPPPPLVAAPPARASQFVLSPQTKAPGTAAGLVSNGHLARVSSFVAESALSPSTFTDILMFADMDAARCFLLRSLNSLVLAELLLGLSIGTVDAPADLVAVQYEFALRTGLSHTALAELVEAALKYVTRPTSASAPDSSQDCSFDDGYGGTPSPWTTTALALEPAVPATRDPSSPAPEDIPVGVSKKRGRAPDDTLEHAGDDHRRRRLDSESARF